MAKRRFITKKEELAYPVLEKISGGKRCNFYTRSFSWYKAYQETSGWGVVHSYNDSISNYELDRDPYTSLFQAMPEIKDKFTEMVKLDNQIQDTARKYDRLREEIIEQLKDTFYDKSANAEHAYVVMTDEDEAVWQDLKANPEKIEPLKVRLGQLLEELDNIPKGKKDPKRKPLEDEIEIITTQLRLVKAI
jgi:hypothetical protein